METTTKKHLNLMESTVIREDERLAGLTLSIPIESEHAASTEALILVFCEGLRAGAGKLSREQFLDAESMLGAHIGVSGDSKFIHITLQSLDTTLAQSLKLLELMLVSPTFAEKEIKRIKELLTNALTLSKEDAKARAYEGFVNTFTEPTDSRYVFPIDELSRMIQKVTAKSLKSFHKILWNSEWIYTSGGSAPSAKKIASCIKKLRGDNVSKVKVSPVSVPFIEREKGSVQLLDIPHKQNIEFSIGNTLPLTRTDTDYPAFIFGMSVLALYGGFSGRLMSTVREKEGLTYSIYGQAEKITKTEQGFWRIATFFAPKDAVKGITATLREIKLIREKGITENELTRFKAIMNTRSSLVNDSLIKKVREVQGLRENDISDAEYKEFKSKLQKMTVTEVQTALKKYLNLETIVISGAGPIQSVKKELEAFKV